MIKPEASPVNILHSQIHTLRSTLVGDDYELAIWAPPGYDTSTHQYPTLYLLDAPLNFGFAIPVVLSQMWEGLAPEMIIVGIGKPIRSYDEWWPIRNRDYAPISLPDQPQSGHAATFLACIRSEIIPFIDTHFRTNMQDRTLWGHSLGGAFVLFALFQQPMLFHRYIATSPAIVLDGLTLINAEAELPPKEQSLPKRLFVSVGSLDNDFGPHINSFVTALHNQRYSGFQFENAMLDGFGHISAFALGFVRGLRAVFSERA